MCHDDFARAEIRWIIIYCESIGWNKISFNTAELLQRYYNEMVSYYYLCKNHHVTSGDVNIYGVSGLGDMTLFRRRIKSIPKRQSSDPMTTDSRCAESRVCDKGVMETTLGRPSLGFK